MMTLVDGGLNLTLIPIHVQKSWEKTETLQKCVDIFHVAIIVDTLLLVIKLVDSSIFEDRMKMLIYKRTTNVESLTIEAVLPKLSRTLIGIHPMCLLPGY